MPIICLQSPAIFTLALLLLLSSASISYAKPPSPTLAEQCPVILSKAIEFDTDATGGLNPTEFANFWSDLIRRGSEIPQQARDVSISQPRTSEDNSSEQVYNILLCQCHYTFHHNLQCCDDTATDDDDDTSSELAIRDDDPLEIWTEVSLEGFTEERVGEGGQLDMAKYSKEFCQNVIYALEKQGIVLGEDVVSGWDITFVSGNSTEVDVVVIGGEENATSITTEATSTTSTTATNVNVASTTSTTATNVIGGKTTVTSSTTSATTQHADKETLAAFDVVFVGSSNGELMAASNDFEDITIAFWKVCFDILEGMTTTTRRRMQWDFGAEAAIYFESVVMDVTDSGKFGLHDCTLSSLLSLITFDHSSSLVYQNAQVGWNML